MTERDALSKRKAITSELLEAIDALGLSHKQVARLAGVRLPTVVNLATCIPHAMTIQRIATALAQYVREECGRCALRAKKQPWLPYWRRGKHELELGRELFSKFSDVLLRTANCKHGHSIIEPASQAYHRLIQLAD